MVVADGETVVIGGILTDDYTDNVTKVPFLGDIPVLGWAFKTTSRSLTKKNLLVFLTPHIVRSRAFNHTGPRRGEAFATSNFAKQVAEIEAGLREPVVHVGDLKPTRDFSDVRDIVRGYWLLLERGTPGEVYNLCSGVDWSIERVLSFLIGQSTAPRIEIRQDPARLRPSDVPILRGSAEKAERAVGWRGTIPLEKTLTDLLEYWRHKVRARAS